MIEDKNPVRTELSALGEFGLIKHIAKHIKLGNPSSIKGIGDDAAVMQYDSGKQTVVSTDLLIEGVHFDLTYCPLKHLGYKAVSVNLSDIYAMNASPKQILVSIAISNRFSLEAIEELYAGMLLACENHKVDLVGGDTSSSRIGMVISITAIGEADKDEIVYRSGAKPGNLLCVSGDLGSAYLGLQLLEREKKIFTENPQIQPDMDGNDYLLERQLKPEARKDVIEQLKEQGVKPTSMIDVSDGLASEILHLCTESKTGCKLYENKIPIDDTALQKAREFNMNGTLCAMNGGEDYELLFTIDIKDHDKIKKCRDVTVIGHITDKSEGTNLVLTGTEMLTPITAQGWDALLSKK
ncbi:MAG: thiamine-phosphate kinase [Bacteroidetes bacterium]|nr:MAG: thiamine-phosphate kinase [Bacteroidota bacterium]